MHATTIATTVSVCTSLRLRMQTNDTLGISRGIYVARTRMQPVAMSMNNLTYTDLTNSLNFCKRMLIMKVWCCTVSVSLPLLISMLVCMYTFTIYRVRVYVSMCVYL